MFYIQEIKKLVENIKKNPEISADEKIKAINLLDEVARLLVLY